MFGIGTQWSGSRNPFYTVCNVPVLFFVVFQLLTSSNLAFIDGMILWIKNSNAQVVELPLHRTVVGCNSAGSVIGAIPDFHFLLGLPVHPPYSVSNFLAVPVSDDLV